MYTVEVEFSDLDRALRNLELSEEEGRARLAALAEEVGAAFIAKCEEESPRGDKWRAHDPRRTGPRFKDLWGYEVAQLSEDTTEVAIGNIHPAAGVILLGRETEWEIPAKSEKGMSFPWEALGWAWVYGARHVTHPPYEGHMTHEKVLGLMRDEIETKLAEVADRIAYKITRP